MPRRELICVIIAAALVLVAGTARAQPVFPPMVAGEYVWRVSADTQYDAQGVPTTQLTRALAIEEVGLDGSAFSFPCQNIGDARVDQEAVYSINHNLLVGLAKRREFNAFAYASTNCTGEKSPASARTGYIFFGAPNAPNLLSWLHHMLRPRTLIRVRA